MKNYRFYAEMSSARRSKSASRHFGAFTRKHLERLAAAGEHINCIAVLLENGRPLEVRWPTEVGFEVVACVSERSNGSVETTSASQEYLRKRCVRISAELAAKLHPRLAAYLK